MRKSSLPSLRELGSDLLVTTSWQRWQPVPMPFIYALGFMVSWHFEIYWLSPLFLVFVFSACSTSTHDVVHRCLGYSARQTEVLLFLLGLPILESGHAYRATHLYHHKRFPHDDDFEGEAAHQSILEVLISGPSFLFRLWLRAWEMTADRPSQRRWLMVEGLFPVVGIVLGLALLPWSSAILAYVLTVLVSSWFYPLFAVHLPHRHFERDEDVRIAWTCRGRWVPRLFLPLAFHLEHHLYPQVPSHNLPLLAERLQPWHARAGVEPVRVP